MSISFLTFLFNQKTSAKKFCRYRIRSNEPYSDKQAFHGNSVRYQIRQRNRQQFVYAYNNKYIFTYKQIKNMPDFIDSTQLELVHPDELIPITTETLGLYEAWIKYFVFNRIVAFSNNHNGFYDCRKENKYKTLLYLDAKSGISIKRTFQIDTKVLLDGTAYLSVDIKCDFESNDTIFDYICKGIDITNLNVTCDWQSYEKTYTVTKLHQETIFQDINGFNLYDYWKEKRPSQIKTICPTTPIVSVLDKKKQQTGFYIPQSLRPIITRNFIAERHRALSKKVDTYTKLSMEKRLKIIQEFLNHLNADKKIIHTNPVDVTEFGYATYDITQNMPYLIVGNQKKIRIQEKYKAFYKDFGFYQLPENIVAAYLGYDSHDASNPTAKTSHELVTSILNYTRGILNNTKDSRLHPHLLPLTFYQGQSFHYQKGNLLSYQEKAQEIKNIPEINFVISTLPIAAEEEDFYQDAVESPYDAYKCAFAERNLPSQMISMNMATELGTKNISYRLQNIILGILSKSGGIPWVLEAPMDDVDCFIGLDVGTQETGIHYPSCSVCLDGTGNLIGYYATSIAQNGEKIDEAALEKIFDQVLIAYKTKHHTYPHHVVIHRDGFSNEGIKWYVQYFQRNNIIFDLVEIRKNISTRLLHPEQISNEMNPNSGMAVIRENKAYLISTEVKPYLGAPRPLLLVHQYGSLSIQQIVRQVYILSEIHVGSMRTSRLPITTLYADKICKHHQHVPHDVLSNQLYFL